MEPSPSSRLVLRTPVAADFADILAYRAHPLVFRFIGEPMSEEDVEEHIRSCQGQKAARDGDCLYFVVELKEKNGVVGEGKLRVLSKEQRELEIGCALHPDLHQRGLGTELAAALLRHAFESMNSHRAVAFIDEENLVSIAMVERLGARREGILREHIFRAGAWRNELLFSVLESEWPAVRKRAAAWL